MYAMFEEHLLFHGFAFPVQGFWVVGRTLKTWGHLLAIIILDLSPYHFGGCFAGTLGDPVPLRSAYWRTFFGCNSFSVKMSWLRVYT